MLRDVEMDVNIRYKTTSQNYDVSIHTETLLMQITYTGTSLLYLQIAPWDMY